MLSAKSTDLDMLTATTISGLNAKIDADTNQDGVLDSTTNVAHISLLLIWTELEMQKSAQ